MKTNPKKTDLETNSRFKSNYNTLSQNEYKSINTINSQQNNIIKHEKEEVSYFNKIKYSHKINQKQIIQIYVMKN